MNDTQHNNMIKYLFKDNKHVRHVLSDQQIMDLTGIESRFPLTKLPVCNHCEKLALWHKDPLTKATCAYCKACGTYSMKPVTYSTYLARGYDIDKTGKNFRQMAEVDKRCEDYKRNVYLPDYSRLEK